MARTGRTFKRTPYSRSDYGASARKAYRSSRYGRGYGVTSSSISRGRRRSMARTGGLLGIENKYLDVYASLLSVPAPADCSGGEMQPEGGCTDCLSCPAQGDGAQNRDGKSIIAKKIFVSGFVSTGTLTDQADVVTPPSVFVALVQDTQANGATVVSEQVFTNPNDSGVVNAFPLRNLEYSSRYKVLDHKTIWLGPANVGTDGANTNSVNGQGKSFVLQYKGDIKMNFAGTTADVANCKDNALHIIAFATTSGFTPVLSYNSRMRFVG